MDKLIFRRKTSICCRSSRDVQELARDLELNCELARVKVYAPQKVVAGKMASRSSDVAVEVKWQSVEFEL